MRRSVIAAWIALFVVLNAGAFLYLRHWLSEPPPNDVATAVAEPGPTGDPRIEGPLWLSGRPDGSVLRVTNGVCREPDAELESEPATVWVAPPGEGPREVQADSLVQTLGVGRTDRGWWIVGTDADCAAATAWTSTDAGQTWQASPDLPVGAWYLEPGDPNHVHSPRGKVTLVEGCLAASVQAGPRQAWVVCTDGRLLVGDRTAPKISTVQAEAGVRSVAVGPAGKVASLSEAPPCDAMLVAEQGRRPLDDGCLATGRAANGITWIGDDLALQLGYALLDYDLATGNAQTRG